LAEITTFFAMPAVVSATVMALPQTYSTPAGLRVTGKFSRPQKNSTVSGCLPLARPSTNCWIAAPMAHSASSALAGQ
jgi:hypothetical protein